VPLAQSRSIPRTGLSICLGVLLCPVLCWGLIISPAAATPNHVLKRYIIEYNLRAIEKHLEDDSYRGEEGILGIKPDIANSLGIKAFINDDYRDAVRLFKVADKALERAKRAMSTRQKEKYGRYYAESIADNFMLFKKNSREAREKLLSYRAVLDPGIDERLDNAVCEELLERLWEESLDKADNNLRDALGYFYNICRDVKGEDFPLTPENVHFVNYVFKMFVEQASEQDVGMFDLDRDTAYRSKGLNDDWKAVLGPELSDLVPLLEAAIKRCRENIYDIDPLLFAALIKKESHFDPLAVSRVGAAGLTQIMPSTAKAIGMDNIHMPGYLNDAQSLLKQEQEIRKKAISVLFRMTEEDKLWDAKEARSLMQKSLELGEQREGLFDRYKKELLEDRTDERLDPAKAIEYGLRYFAELMKTQQGDISLALASYNAGPHRVQEYGGIPPYEETVGFRNRILKYYKEYISRAGSE
jgi:soluble lytic murein transglycosylase-like protein